MPQPLIGRDATSDLGVSLNTDAKSLNNAVKLLSLLRPGRDASATRSAIIALERFFSERLCRGDLRDPEPEDDAAAVKYAEWFAKHYKLFTKRLVALLAGAPRPDASGPTPARSSAADAKTQVLALAAVMECARSERPGRFNNELYHEALAAAVTGDAFTPELLGALASRYLVKMDVRYHTYRAVVKLAATLGPKWQAPTGFTQLVLPPLFMHREFHSKAYLPLCTKGTVSDAAGTPPPPRAADGTPLCRANRAADREHLQAQWLGTADGGEARTGAQEEGAHAARDVDEGALLANRQPAAEGEDQPEHLGEHRAQREVRGLLRPHPTG